MARLYLNDFYSFGGNPDDILEVEWEVWSLVNGAKGELLFNSLESGDGRFATIATLVNGDGSLYDPNKGAIVSVRIRMGAQWQDPVTKTCLGGLNEH